MTMMMSDLDRSRSNSFVNTSFCEQDSEQYGAIFDALWKHAVTLRENSEYQ